MSSKVPCEQPCDLRSTTSTDDSFDPLSLELSCSNRHEDLKRSSSSDDVRMFGNSGGRHEGLEQNSGGRHEGLEQSNGSNDVNLLGRSIDGASDPAVRSFSVGNPSYEQRRNPYLDAPEQLDCMGHMVTCTGRQRFVLIRKPKYNLDTSEQTCGREHTVTDRRSSNQAYANPSFDYNEEPADEHHHETVFNVWNQTQGGSLQHPQLNDLTASRSRTRTSQGIASKKRCVIAAIIAFVIIGAGTLIALYLPKGFQGLIDNFDCNNHRVHRGETAVFRCTYSRDIMETVTNIQVHDASDFLSSLEPIQITINDTHNFTVSVRQWTMDWNVNDDNVVVTWSKSNTTCNDNLKINVIYFNETSNVVTSGTMNLTISDGQTSLTTHVDSAIDSDNEEIQYKVTGEGYGGCSAPSLSMTLVIDRVGEVIIPMECETIEKSLRFFRCVHSFSRNKFQIIDDIEFQGSFQKTSRIHPKRLTTDLPCTRITECQLNKECRLWCKIQLKGNIVDNLRVKVRREGLFNSIIAIIQPTSEESVVTAGNGGRMNVHYRREHDVMHFNMTFNHTECNDGGNYSLIFPNGKTISMKITLSGLPNFCNREQRFPIGQPMKKHCSICLPDLISNFQFTKRFYSTETNSFQVKVIGNSTSLAEGLNIKLNGTHNIADIRFDQNVTSISDHANFSVDFTYGYDQSYIFEFKHIIDVTCSSYRECRMHRSCEAHCKLPTESYEDFYVSVQRDGYIKENLAILGPSSFETVNKDRMKMYIAKVDDGIYFNLKITDTRCNDAGNYSLIPSSGETVNFVIFVTGLPSYCSPEDKYTLGGTINKSCIYCVPDHVMSLSLTKVFHDASNKLRKLNLGVPKSTNMQIASDLDGLAININNNMIIIRQLNNFTCLDEAQYIIQVKLEGNSSLTYNFSNTMSVPEYFMTSKMEIDSRGYTNRQNASLTYEAILGCSVTDITFKSKGISELKDSVFFYVKTIKEFQQQNPTKLPNTLEKGRKVEKNHTVFYDFSVNSMGIIQLRMKIIFHPIAIDMNNTLFTGNVQLRTKSNSTESTESSERIYVIFENTKDICPATNESCNYAHPYYSTMYLGCSFGHDLVEVRPCPPGTTKFEPDECDGECT